MKDPQQSPKFIRISDWRGRTPGVDMPMEWMINWTEGITDKDVITMVSSKWQPKQRKHDKRIPKTKVPNELPLSCTLMKNSFLSEEREPNATGQTYFRIQGPLPWKGHFSTNFRLDYIEIRCPGCNPAAMYEIGNWGVKKGDQEYSEARFAYWKCCFWCDKKELYAVCRLAGNELVDVECNLDSEGALKSMADRLMATGATIPFDAAFFQGSYVSSGFATPFDKYFSEKEDWQVCVSD